MKWSEVLQIFKARTTSASISINVQCLYVFTAICNEKQYTHELRFFKSKSNPTRNVSPALSGTCFGQRPGRSLRQQIQSSAAALYIGLAM